MGRFIKIDDINVEIIRKKGKKTLSLKLDFKSGRPQLSIPYFCPLFYAKSFLNKHIVWLKNNIQTTPQKRSFCDGMQIRLFDEDLTICLTPYHCAVHIEGKRILVGCEKEHLHRRIKDFIKKELYDYIFKKAHETALIAGQKIKKITIKDTSSRWGSCSSNANLSFCWRLALAPVYVLDYVIIHEVAHLNHMDHSPLFWSHVKTLGGQKQKAKKWLKENGTHLHSFL